jgi:transposase
MSRKNDKDQEPQLFRAIKHYFQGCNDGKLAMLHLFLDEYRIACQFFIDYIFSHAFENFDIQNDILDYLPQYLSYQIAETFVQEQGLRLSARALSSALTQSIGIVRGRISVRRKLLYIIKKRKEENKPIEYFEKQLDKNPIIKPTLHENFGAEISSKLIDFQDDSVHFDSFLRIKSTGFDHIKIPLSYSKADKKWIKKKAQRINSILLKKNSVSIRYALDTPPLKKRGRIVGADTGFKSIITLSDGQELSAPDPHGHTLQSICETLSKRKKGSKNFKQTQTQRENHINYSINQLNLKGIKQVNLEEVKNIFFRRRTSRLMSGWTNEFIENKFKRLAEEQGVLVKMQDSQYRSQRCCECGLVLKSNRKGKLYKCKECGKQIDSDLNAALNHEVELPAISYNLRAQKLNIAGFFWKETGLFALSGEKLESLISKKNY